MPEQFETISLRHSFPPQQDKIGDEKTGSDQDKRDAPRNEPQVRVKEPA